MNTYKAYAFLTIACIGMSIGPPAYLKLLETGIDAVDIIGFFLLIGGGAMGVINMFFPVREISYSKRVGGKWRAILVLGTISLLWPLFFLGFVYAMESSSVAQVSLIVRVSPLFVVLLSTVLLSESIRSWRGVMGAIALSLLGLLVVQYDSNILQQGFWKSAFLLGILVGLANALSEVLRSYASRFLHLNHTNVIALTMSIGGLVTLLAQNVFGEVNMIDTQQLLLVIALGLGTVAIPAQLNLSAYAILKSQSKVSFFGYLVPIGSALIAYIWLGEQINYTYFVVGFVLITGGILLANSAITTTEDVLVNHNSD